MSDKENHQHAFGCVSSDWRHLLQSRRLRTLPLQRLLFCLWVAAVETTLITADDPQSEVMFVLGLLRSLQHGAASAHSQSQMSTVIYESLFVLWGQQKPDFGGVLSCSPVFNVRSSEPKQQKVSFSTNSWQTTSSEASNTDESALKYSKKYDNGV